MTVELFLDAVPPRRRAAAVYQQLRDAIADGRLAGGDRLPTTRDLAADLGLARSTVATVYARLVAEGYTTGRIGDGTFVAERQHSTRPPHSAPGPSTPARPHPWRADLRTGRPDPRLFPVVAWRRSALTALQAAPPGYGDPAGLPLLRAALVAWVGRSRGVVAAPEQVVVTAGAQGAFDLLARTVVAPGAAIAVENPGYPPAWRAFRNAGARLLPVPVDRHGLVVDRLPSSARAVYTTPSHQAPTGAILSGTRRRQLLELVGRDDLIVIEDDYDTEFRYVDRPIEPLQRLDPGRVVYVGSFSKTVSPSLRLGFIVAPPHLADALGAARADVDTQPPFLTQAALAAFTTSGELDRHLRRTRRTYRARRAHLLGRLAGLVADGTIVDHDPCLAGLHVTVRLGDDVAVSALVDGLEGRGVAVNRTSRAWLGDVGPLLELGFGLADESAIDIGLAELAAVLGATGRRPRPTIGTASTARHDVTVVPDTTSREPRRPPSERRPQ